MGNGTGPMTNGLSTKRSNIDTMGTGIGAAGNGGMMSAVSGSRVGTGQSVAQSDRRPLNVLNGG